MWCAKIINLSDINDKYHVFFIVYIRQFPDKANKNDNITPLVPHHSAVTVSLVSHVWYRKIQYLHGCYITEVSHPLKVCDRMKN